jgi:hypothetical protein
MIAETVAAEEKTKEEEYNETIVTLRLPKKYYKTAYAVAHLLGHDSFDEYVSYTVMQNMRMEIGGGEKGNGSSFTFHTFALK